MMQYVRLTLISAVLFSAGCVGSDLKDPVGAIRRLVSRYNPSILPKRVSLPVARPGQNGGGTEQGTAIVEFSTVSASLSATSHSHEFLKLALDQVAERTQQLSLETLMIDKAWDGIKYYCKYFNTGTDGSAMGTITTLTIPTGTRTDAWVNCKVAEGQVNVKIDQDLIAAVQEAMGGDDISEGDKKELQSLDGKSINLQEMEIHRNGGASAMDYTTGSDNGYAFKVRYNFNDSANTRTIRWNAARSQIDLMDNETHTDEDGTKFEERGHLNTLFDESSGKQISNLQLNIKYGKENYIGTIAMQQDDTRSGTNGAFVGFNLEVNGYGENYQVYVQGAIDDNGGYAVSNHQATTSTITGYTALTVDGDYIIVSSANNCGSPDWDDAYAYISRSGTDTKYFWGRTGTAITSDICKITLDEDGNITGSTLQEGNVAITGNITPGTLTTYHEVFDGAGALIAQDTAVTGSISSSAYYQTFIGTNGTNSGTPGANLLFADGITAAASAYPLTGVITDFVVFPGNALCSSMSTTNWNGEIIGYGKHRGTATQNAADYFIRYWGTATQTGAGNNRLCLLTTDANGAIVFEATGATHVN